MYNCGICEFLKFGNFGNLRRHWKIVRLHTCTICDHEFERAGSLRRHKRLVHSLPRPLPRSRKPRQPIRRSSSDDLDDSTVMEPWSLNPTSVEKTTNPTMVRNLDVADVSVATVVKKPKITRPGAISRRKCGVIDIFSGDMFNPEHVKRKQKPRAPKKSKQVCSVKDTPTLVKKSPVCDVSMDQSSSTRAATKSPADNILMPGAKMLESKSTQRLLLVKCLLNYKRKVPDVYLCMDHFSPI